MSRYMATAPRASAFTAFFRVSPRDITTKEMPDPMRARKVPRLLHRMMTLSASGAVMATSALRGSPLWESRLPVNGRVVINQGCEAVRGVGPRSPHALQSASAELTALVDGHFVADVTRTRAMAMKASLRSACVLMTALIRSSRRTFSSINSAWLCAGPAARNSAEDGVHHHPDNRPLHDAEVAPPFFRLRLPRNAAPTSTSPEVSEYRRSGSWSPHHHDSGSGKEGHACRAGSPILHASRRAQATG